MNSKKLRKPWVVEDVCCHSLDNISLREELAITFRLEKGVSPFLSPSLFYSRIVTLKLISLLCLLKVFTPSYLEFIFRKRYN